MQSQSWLTERNLATFSTHLFLPGRLRFPCTQTHTRTHAHAADPTQHYIIPPLVHLKSPLSPLTPRLPRNDPDAPSLLTVQGVSGDLTSHGGMQGAFFTFLSRRASGGEAWRSATALSRTADYILRLKQAARGGRRGRSKAQKKNACQRAGVRVRTDGGGGVRESLHPAAAAASWPLAPASRRDCHRRWCWRWSFRGCSRQTGRQDRE